MKKLIILPVILFSICTLGYSQYTLKFACSSEAPKSEKEYQTWLKADIAYLITRVEKNAFLSLKTNKERDQFIADFWLRRDPDPDTKGNEFRDKYCKRIDYANAHFSSGIPGWKTDRGRVYITHGEPDKLEKGRGNFDNFKNVLFEEWIYNDGEVGCGLGSVSQPLRITFIDPTESDEFSIYSINGSTDIAKKDDKEMVLCM